MSYPLNTTPRLWQTHTHAAAVDNTTTTVLPHTVRDESAAQLLLSTLPELHAALRPLVTNPPIPARHHPHMQATL